MYGMPMTALHKGAIQIGETILELDQNHRPFDKLITVPYETRIQNEFVAKDLESYKNQIATIKASGSTNFVVVFKRITEYLKVYPELKELIVIFFTDGEDTCNQKVTLKYNLDMMSAELKSRQDIRSRFLSIGFS